MDGGADRNGGAETGRTVPCRIFAGVVLALAAGCLSGCMIVQVGVTNPVPGLTTIAVAPFFNQSEERAVDGRRFAIAYASELQKIPGLEVIPVGVVETRMRELGLQQLSGPSDALKIAEALNADAVVIGSVTEYQPYYPPRIGMSIAWYSPLRHRFSPGIPTNPRAKRQLVDAVKDAHGLGLRRNVRRTTSSLSQLADRFFLEDGNGQVDGTYGDRNWNSTVPDSESGSKPAPPSRMNENAGNGGNRFPSFVPPPIPRSSTLNSQVPNSRVPNSPIPRPSTSRPSTSRPSTSRPSSTATPGKTQRRPLTGESVIRGQSPSPSTSPDSRWNRPTSARIEPRRSNRLAAAELQRPRMGAAPMKSIRSSRGIGEVELPNFPVPWSDSAASAPSVSSTQRAGASFRRRVPSSRGEQTGFSPPVGTIRKIVQNPPMYGVTREPPMPKRAPGPQQMNPLQVPRRLPVEQTPLKLSLQFSPLMSYTRIFDAADADLVAIWRDHLEMTGDQRQGDWVAQLYWSENFLRFTARLMIVEMFQLHGGQAKRRIILKFRKYR